MYFKKEELKNKRIKKDWTPKTKNTHKYIMHVCGKRKRKNKGKNVIADNILSKTACVIKRERSEHSVIANTIRQINLLVIHYSLDQHHGIPQKKQLTAIRHSPYYSFS
jgi:hypothetical protein